MPYGFRTLFDSVSRIISVSWLDQIQIQILSRICVGSLKDHSGIIRASIENIIMLAYPGYVTKILIALQYVKICVIVELAKKWLSCIKGS